MSRTFEYDVFMSHNHADKPRVRRLAKRLQSARLRVWFDEWVIQLGDDIYLAIERGLEAARTLVLCLSLTALGSDWVGWKAASHYSAIHSTPDAAASRLRCMMACCLLIKAVQNAFPVTLNEADSTNN